jgi:hypothetical protein
MSEPTITINGGVLSEGQAMTVRVALETFALSLFHEGLGQDATGTAICRGYLARIEEIRGMMFRVAERGPVRDGEK